MVAIFSEWWLGPTTADHCRHIPDNHIIIEATNITGDDVATRSDFPDKKGNTWSVHNA